MTFGPTIIAFNGLKDAKSVKKVFEVGGMRILEQDDKFFLRLEKEEELNASLQSFMEQYGLASASVNGVGAVKEAELGFYHLSKKEYERKVFSSEMELVSMIGNLAWLDGKAIAHTHIACGLEDFSLIGGHLFEAKVAVTVEVAVQSYSDKMSRKMDEAIGLNLLDLKKCEHS